MVPNLGANMDELHSRRRVSAYRTHIKPATSVLWESRRNLSYLDMAGMTGLEPATSAVTGLPFLVFQRLTNPWGTPNVLSRERPLVLWIRL